MSFIKDKMVLTSFSKPNVEEYDEELLKKQW